MQCPGNIATKDTDVQRIPAFIRMPTECNALALLQYKTLTWSQPSYACSLGMQCPGTIAIQGTDVQRIPAFICIPTRNAMSWLYCNTRHWCAEDPSLHTHAHQECNDLALLQYKTLTCRRSQPSYACSLGMQCPGTIAIQGTDVQKIPAFICMPTRYAMRWHYSNTRHWSVGGATKPQSVHQSCSASMVDIWQHSPGLCEQVLGEESQRPWLGGSTRHTTSITL